MRTTTGIKLKRRQEIDYVEAIQQTVNQAGNEFSDATSEETIQRVAAKLRDRNIEVLVVDDGDAARKPF